LSSVILSLIIPVVQEIGKFAVIVGVILVVLGILLWRFPMWFGWLGHLPGDISIRKGNFGFYFPLATCILISILLTLVTWILRR
jgi:uncharacterized protein involved in cysteine biosynthesis